MLDDCRSAALIGASGLFGRHAARTWWWGTRLTGPIVALTTASMCSCLGLMPDSSRVHTACWDVALPLSLSLTLLGTNMTQTPVNAPSLVLRTGIAFGMGSLGSCLGALTSFQASPLDTERLAPAVSSLFASYVGGSANFFAVAKATGGDPSLMSALAAADVALMALYFSGLSLVAPGKVVVPQKVDSIAVLPWLPAGLVIVGLSKVVSMGRAGLETCALAIFSLAAGLYSFKTKNGGPLADICLHLFYAALGASASPSRVATAGPAALFLATLTLVIHVFVISLVLLCKQSSLKPTLSEILLGSNAGIGGPSTAAAFALALDRPDLVLPAVVWGTVGYATATSGGIALHNALLASTLPRNGGGPAIF